VIISQITKLILYVFLLSLSQLLTARNEELI